MSTKPGPLLVMARLDRAPEGQTLADQKLILDYVNSRFEQREEAALKASMTVETP